jgi:RsiW-degrading membrane proteinase PrsW (M82 family)
VSSLVAPAISVLPVFLFLGTLVVIDSYKLVSVRAVLWAVLAGVVAAGASYVVNVTLQPLLGLPPTQYSRYLAPGFEEALKAAYLVYLLSRNKLGFVVDAAITGFAIGTGFAFVENLYYLTVNPDASIWTWFVRGFGTAVMHGGCTALVAMVAKATHTHLDGFRLRWLLPGLGIAVVLHSLYNHFLLQPLIATGIIMLLFPWISLAVFERSERATKEWLGTGFDVDQELLRAMREGQMAATPVGQYLATLRTRFVPEVIVDMLCLLRLRAELGIRAKGILMMREAGFEPEPDPAVRGTFEELRYLEKNIGPTGMLSLHPFLHTSTQDLWQLNVVDEVHG